MRRFLTPQGGAADSHIPYINNISQMTHTSAVNSKKQGGRQGSGKQAVSGPFKYLSYAEESAAGENQRAQRSQSKQDLFHNRYSLLTVLCPPLSGHAISAPLCRPAPVYQRKAAPFYPAVRGRTESLRFTALNTLCTAALSGSSFKNALPSRRWPSRRLYTCVTTIPCPTAASAASETHRRRAKGVFALSPWPVYVSQPRASVTEADTRPPALLISSPVWARRKSPRGTGLR